jgi:Fe-S-cluster-containing hydrogenase component 2
VLGLLVLFFLYEWLDIWASPALTVWLIVAYFVASFVLEASFGESPFCKYVCPLGTFNFVYSTVSPTQITSKNLDICRQCVGKECVNGSYSPTPVIRLDEIKGGDAQIVHNAQGTAGCGTQLFVPQIQSNLDCMMCLDCVRACPHDNVALMVRAPWRELLNPDAWQKRWDIAFMVVSLTFFAVVNAFGMIPPVYDLMQTMATTLGLVQAGWSNEAIEAVELVIIFVTGGLLLPGVALVGGAWLSRLLARSQQKHSLRHVATGFAPAFVPLGLGVWFGHYGFHFLVGALSIIPVFQTFLIDHSIYLLGTSPNWDLARLIPDNSLIALIQVVALIGGFFGSLFVAQRIALRLYRRDAPLGLLPWALVLLALMLATIAIFSQPMEMRGTILFS